MRRRVITLLSSALLVLGIAASPAAADQWDDHGHMLLLGVQEVDEEDADIRIGPEQTPVTLRKCVDLANGQAIPLHAHHAGVHTGTAGEALLEAGHAVLPTGGHPAGMEFPTGCDDL